MSVFSVSHWPAASVMKPEFQHMLRDAFSGNENNCFNKMYINLSN